MSGQATGKRQHLPLRMRMYYQPASSNDALLFDARIGTRTITSIEDLIRFWRPGVELNAVIAVISGSAIHRLIVAPSTLSGGATVDMSDSSTWCRVVNFHTTSAVPLQPTAGQLAAASDGGMKQWPQLHQICSRNDTLK